jgi:CHASE1-domain containing sensor protein
MRSFEIKELDPEGFMTRAARRHEYFPAWQLEPQNEVDEVLLGFDLGSEAVMQDAVNRARDRGKLVISAPVRRLLENGDQLGILIVAPAYTTAATPVSVAQRRHGFMGVAVWLLPVRNIVGDALRGMPQDGIEIRTRICPCRPTGSCMTQERGPPSLPPLSCREKAFSTSVNATGC